MDEDFTKIKENEYKLSEIKKAIIKLQYTKTTDKDEIMKCLGISSEVYKSALLFKNKEKKCKTAALKEMFKREAFIKEYGEINIQTLLLLVKLYREQCRNKARGIVTKQRETNKYYDLKVKVDRWVKGQNKCSPPKTPYTYLDVVKKFGENPKCSLTGLNINYSEGKTYHLDHIIPQARGGTNELDNMQILCSEVNLMKGCLKEERFIQLCYLVASNDMRENKEACK